MVGWISEVMLGCALIVLFVYCSFAVATFVADVVAKAVGTNVGEDEDYDDSEEGGHYGLMR